MTKSINLVQSVKLTNTIAAGQGAHYDSVAMVELSGSATMGDLVKALEGAQTPHKAAAPPGVIAIVPGKLKAGTTPVQIIEALKKAGPFGGLEGRLFSRERTQMDAEGGEYGP